MKYTISCDLISFTAIVNCVACDTHNMIIVGEDSERMHDHESTALYVPCEHCGAEIYIADAIVSFQEFVSFQKEKESNKIGMANADRKYDELKQQYDGLWERVKSNEDAMQVQTEIIEEHQKREKAEDKGSGFFNDKIKELQRMVDKQAVTINHQSKVIDSSNRRRSLFIDEAVSFNDEDFSNAKKYLTGTNWRKTIKGSWTSKDEEDGDDNQKSP